METNIEPEQQNHIKKLISWGFADNEREAEKLLDGQLIIIGFDEDPEYELTNNFVQELITKIYGKIPDLRFGKIAKEGKYLLRIPPAKAESIDPLIEQGIGQQFQPDSVVASNIEEYFKLACALENVSANAELKNSYKVRAAGAWDTEINAGMIRFFRFHGENPYSYQYLKDLNLADEQKMKLYAWGTLIHEIGHWVDKQKNLLDEHLEIDQPLTEYVEGYAQEKKENLRGIQEENWAEAFRLYVTNYEYLKKISPDIAEIIGKEFPEIPKNALWGFLKSKKNFKLFFNWFI